VDKELIIDAHTSEINIVFLEDKRLVEFHKEKKDNNYAVGDIYLGRVKKIASGLNAAFIDIGYKKDGFLHYFDTNQQNIKTLYKYTKHVISGNYNQKQPVNNKSTKEKEVKKISDKNTKKVFGYMTLVIGCFIIVEQLVN
jgi:ribonuclease G